VRSAAAEQERWVVASALAGARPVRELPSCCGVRRDSWFRPGYAARDDQHSVYCTPVSFIDGNAGRRVVQSLEYRGYERGRAPFMLKV